MSRDNLTCGKPPNGSVRTLQCVRITAPYRNSQVGCASHGVPTGKVTAPRLRWQLGKLGSNRPMRCSKLDLLKTHSNTGIGTQSWTHWFCTPCSFKGFCNVFCIIPGQKFSCIYLTDDTPDSSKSSVDVLHHDQTKLPSQFTANTMFCSMWRINSLYNVDLQHIIVSKIISFPACIPLDIITILLARLLAIILRQGTFLLL